MLDKGNTFLNISPSEVMQIALQANYGLRELQPMGLRLDEFITMIREKLVGDICLSMHLNQMDEHGSGMSAIIAHILLRDMDSFEKFMRESPTFAIGATNLIFEIARFSSVSNMESQS
jgi:hypothetical protein